MRVDLRRMQAAMHPDKTGGIFSNENVKAEYHKLNEAISYIDELKADNSNQVTIAAVTSLTNAIANLVLVQSETHTNKNMALSEEISKSVSNYNSKQKMPRIALSAISVALTAIWVFPNTIKDHPILGKLIDFSDIKITVIWFYLLFTFAFLWLLTWRKEEINKQFKESLKTETVQNKIFKNFISLNGNSQFTLEELVEFIIIHFKNRDRRISIFEILGRGEGIDLSLANVIAEVIIERGLKRSALGVISSGTISNIYFLKNVPSEKG